MLSRVHYHLADQGLDSQKHDQQGFEYLKLAISRSHSYYDAGEWRQRIDYVCSRITDQKQSLDLIANAKNEWLHYYLTQELKRKSPLKLGMFPEQRLLVNNETGVCTAQFEIQRSTRSPESLTQRKVKGPRKMSA